MRGDLFQATDCAALLFLTGFKLISLTERTVVAFTDLNLKWALPFFPSTLYIFLRNGHLNSSHVYIFSTVILYVYISLFRTLTPSTPKMSISISFAVDIIHGFPANVHFQNGFDGRTRLGSFYWQKMFFLMGEAAKLSTVGPFTSYQPFSRFMTM